MAVAPPPPPPTSPPPHQHPSSPFSSSLCTAGCFQFSSLLYHNEPRGDCVWVFFMRSIILWSFGRLSNPFVGFTPFKCCLHQHRVRVLLEEPRRSFDVQRWLMSWRKFGLVEPQQERRHKILISAEIKITLYNCWLTRPALHRRMRFPFFVFLPINLLAVNRSSRCCSLKTCIFLLPGFLQFGSLKNCFSIQLAAIIPQSNQCPSMGVKFVALLLAAKHEQMKEKHLTSSHLFIVNGLFFFQLLNKKKKRFVLKCPTASCETSCHATAVLRYSAVVHPTASTKCWGCLLFF